MENTQRDIVCNNIKRLMKENDISMDELALMLGYESKSTISKHLSGKSNALNNLDIIDKYANVFKLRTSDLLEDIKMKMEKYPVPDSRMADNVWAIFYETVKNFIGYELKSRYLKEIGMDTDDFMEPMYESFQTIACYCFATEKTQRSPEYELCDDEPYQDTFYLINGVYWLLDNIVENLLDNINITVDEILQNRDISIDDVAYECATNIYLDFFDSRAFSNLNE